MEGKWVFISQRLFNDPKHLSEFPYKITADGFSENLSACLQIHICRQAGATP